MVTLGQMGPVWTKDCGRHMGCPYGYNMAIRTYEHLSSKKVNRELRTTIFKVFHLGTVLKSIFTYFEPTL